MYKKGEFIVIRQKSYQCDVEMGRIILMLYDNHEGIFLVVENVTTSFISSLRVYEVGPKVSYECVSIEHMASAQSCLHAFSNGSRFYVKLRFGLVFDQLE